MPLPWSDPRQRTIQKKITIKKATQDSDNGKARHITVVLKHQLLPQEIKNSEHVHPQSGSCEKSFSFVPALILPITSHSLYTPSLEKVNYQCHLSMLNS